MGIAHKGVTNAAPTMTARQTHDQRHKPEEVDKGNFVTEWGGHDIYIH